MPIDKLTRTPQILLLPGNEFFSLDFIKNLSKSPKSLEIFKNFFKKKLSKSSKSLAFFIKNHFAKVGRMVYSFSFFISVAEAEVIGVSGNEFSISAALVGLVTSSIGPALIS